MEMGKQTYLEKQRAINRGFFDAGLQMGRQQIMDMMCVVLNDPSVMGKDTLGKQRLLKVISGIGSCIDQYQTAWEKHDETDYYRAKLDEKLSDIFGDEMLDTFDKRYEFCPNYNYMKGRWDR